MNRIKYNEKKILVTGSGSGLGKFLCKKLDADDFSRKNATEFFTTNHNYDTIIHTAFNRSSNPLKSDFRSYLDDNIFLTERLTKIPHQKFIYISSIDIYPKDLPLVGEEDDFLVDGIGGWYGRSKLIAEEIVKKNCKNSLILRPSAMIGKDSRENSLIKILKNLPTKLTLSPYSSFNYILHDDVLSFIRKAVDQNLEGTFNLASSSNIDLQTVVKKYDNKNIEFGEFLYKTQQLNNNKAKSVSDVFNKSSLDNIEIFKKMISF